MIRCEFSTARRDADISTSMTVIAKAQTSVAFVTRGIGLSSATSNSYASHRIVPDAVVVVNPDTSRMRDKPKSLRLASRLSLIRIFVWGIE